MIPVNLSHFFDISLKQHDVIYSKLKYFTLKTYMHTHKLHVVGLSFIFSVLMVFTEYFLHDSRMGFGKKKSHIDFPSSMSSWPNE